jgi:hypothetical protein
VISRIEEGSVSGKAPQTRIVSVQYNHGITTTKVDITTTKVDAGQGNASTLSVELMMVVIFLGSDKLIRTAGYNAVPAVLVSLSDPTMITTIIGSIGFALRQLV